MFRPLCHAAAFAAIGLTASVAAAQTPQVPPAAASAQQSFLTTPAFAQLVNGKSIVVVTREGREYEGHFTVSGQKLVMTGSKIVTTVPFDEIARVEKSTFRIRFHSLIGAGIGAAVGARFAWDVCEGPCRASDEFWLVAIGAGIGSGIGAYVGAQSNARNHQDDIIYDIGRHIKTVAIAPILSPTRKGFAFSMTWR